MTEAEKSKRHQLREAQSSSRSRGEDHVGGHGWPMMSRSTANYLKGSQRDNRVVTLTLLALTFSVHGCELALAQICHVRFDAF